MTTLGPVDRRAKPDERNLRRVDDPEHRLDPAPTQIGRFPRAHPLRSADALQLAAACAAAEHRPASLQFVTLDERLAGAARKEGFTMVDVAAD